MRSRQSRHWRLWGMGVGLLLGIVAIASAELADVYLKTGLRLRGDVTVTDSEVIIRNALGESRYPRDQVARIVPVAEAPQPEPIRPDEPPTTTQPAGEAAEISTQPAGGAAETQPSGEMGAVEPGEGPEGAAETQPAGLPPPPLLSERDIQRLKFSELRVDGPPERLRIRIEGRDLRDISQEVLTALQQRRGFLARWEDILLRGQPHERLQLIAQTTGTQYIDSLKIVGDPAVFDEFRRRVLPVVIRGCARHGCHAGDQAVGFRFPEGPQRTDEFAYTTFALLERMATQHGPLINRMNPEGGMLEGSVLLSHMLPPEHNPQSHPPVEGRRRWQPTLRGRDNPTYERIRDWVNSLRTPRPRYGLEYDFPDWVTAHAAAEEPTEAPPEADPLRPEEEAGEPGLFPPPDRRR